MAPLDQNFFQDWWLVTFGDSWSNIELTLSIRCWIFFLKANHFDNFFPKLYWIESTTNKIISKSIHNDNFLIIYRFPTIYLQNTKINQFSMIIQSFSNNYSIYIAEGNNLTFINVFTMILVRAITSPKVSGVWWPLFDMLILTRLLSTSWVNAASQHTVSRLQIIGDRLHTNLYMLY